MKPTSLRRLLMLQWTGFTLSLLLGFGTIAVVALYVLEDSFIDRRLIDAEQALHRSALPQPPVQLLRGEQLPPDQRASLSALAPGALREFRLADGRYLHVRVLPADARGLRVLAIDAQDELRVGDALRDSAPMLAFLLALVVLLAIGLARRFVRRVEASLAGLLPVLDADDDASRLRSAAARQPVEEFQRFGNALADALDARLDALNREADTLRFLAHELRTPLQGARLAFSRLNPAAGSEAAHARLQRCLQRLERASAAVLWLGEQAPEVAPNDVVAPALQLVDDLQPLATQRGQQIDCDIDAALRWALPTPAIEAVIGNLLLNGIQHGAPGTIHLQIDARSLRIDNRCDALEPSSGFGLGLELSRRLLARSGWTLRGAVEGDRFVVCAEAPSD